MIVSTMYTYNIHKKVYIYSSKRAIKDSCRPPITPLARDQKHHSGHALLCCADVEFDADGAEPNTPAALNL